MWRNMEFFIKILKVSIIVTSCHARVLSTPRQARLSLAEPMPSYYYRNIDGQPGTYSFGYDVADPATGNTQFRSEERYPNGTVVGSYGHIDNLGRPHRYRYIADERGYRVMRDPPRKSYYEVPTTNLLEPGAVTTESSITWTRPSKKNNKQNIKLNNNHIQRRNYINMFNDISKYPRYSYYV